VVSRGRQRQEPDRPPKKGVSWLKIVFLSSFILCGLGLGVLYAYLRELPDLSLLQNEPSQSTRIYDVNGQLVSQLCLEQRTLIPLSRVPQALQEAVLATEDVRFYKHWGIDFLGIFRAFLMNIRAGRVVEGGSTITKQLARNLFLTREQTIARKAREALLSLQIERNFTKKQILEMYLNQIYFGQGAYGVESAARTYFGKPAEELSLAECAMLAGMPKAPSNYDPYKNPLGALQRRNKVLNNLAEEGFISLQEATEARTNPWSSIRSRCRRHPTSSSSSANSWRLSTAPRRLQGRSRGLHHARLEDATRGPTSLDPGLQDAENVARRSRAGGIPVTQPIQGALMAIDPKTGAIRAMIGGRDYRESVFNRAVQAQRQPGSSFKPIIYAAAIENGYTFADVFLDSPSVYLDPSTNKEWRPATFPASSAAPPLSTRP
jgi:penicillin-binding protein 1A